MLGIGTGIMDAAARGAGGAAAFNPSQLTLLAAYEFFDQSSLMKGYRNGISNNLVYRAEGKPKVDTDLIGTVVDKASLPGWDGTQTFQEWLDATAPDLDADFSSATGWTLGGSWSITGGQLVSGGGNSTKASYDITATSDSFYYIEVTFGADAASGSWSIWLGGTQCTIDRSATSSTTFQGLFWSDTAGDGTFAIESVFMTADIDSIKVWHAPGNHLFAGNSADRGTTETVSTINVLRQGDNDWYLSDAGLFQPTGTNISGLAMIDPVNTNVSSYGGITGMGDNGTGGDSILFGNSSGLSLFTPNILIDDGTSTENLHTEGATRTALQLGEWNLNGGTSFEFWQDGVSATTATPTYTVDMTAQQATNKISLGTTPAGSDTFDAWGDFYAVYWYEGDRSEDLFNYVNDNTGSNF